MDTSQFSNDQKFATFFQLLVSYVREFFMDCSMLKDVRYFNGEYDVIVLLNISGNSGNNNELTLNRRFGDINEVNEFLNMILAVVNEFNDIYGYNHIIGEDADRD